MSKSIGVFIDISNIYHCLSNRYNERTLDYSAYLRFLEPIGKVKTAIAYGVLVGRGANAFRGQLTHLGFETKYKRPNSHFKCDWSVGMSVDLMGLTKDLDIIVLGSANGNMAPCITKLQEEGKNCIILASNISAELRKVANKTIEIPESLLEVPTESQLLRRSKDAGA